ncbi:acyl-CoA thioesterase [Janibacter alittae]|uniref:Acyl-CoA thioesterase domain-containing protein n=1 Tax=Janibacter alittae TaxID=3115209 RepID=A0ABZ2MG20_9MICO
MPDLLELTCIDDPAARVSTWVGRPQDVPAGRSFGGLLLAQALLAAGRTVPDGQQVVSQQSDFITAAPTDQPLRWEVTRMGDSPSLSTRRSRLLDPRGSELFAATTRWAVDRDDLPSYDAVLPRSAPDPESLADLHDHFARIEQVPPWWRVRRPVHVRHVVPPSYTESGPRTDEQTAFFRSIAPLPADSMLHAAVAAYVSDMCLVEPAFTALGAARHAPGGLILSLTHALTFHRPLDISDWAQCDCRVRVVAHGRAEGRSDLFDTNGMLAVSASQLALVRMPYPPST